MRNRTGAIITVANARKYGWKVGQKVPVISNTVKKDGSHTWTFDILAIVDDVDHPGVATYFVSNYDYVDQERIKDKGTVDRMIVRIKDPARATQISRTIDRMYANSSAPTRTGSEKSEAQSGLRELGDVGFFTRAIVVAVLFMMLFLTGNTMMQSVRERIPEFAVLKALGYSDRGILALVFAEAVVVCILAALVGLAIAKIGMPWVKDVSPNLGQMLLMPWSALLTGFAFALAVAFISAFIPALRAKRLNVVDALAGRA